MPIDVAAERLDAAQSIQDESSLVLEFRQSTYLDDVKAGETTVYAPALLDLSKPSRDRDIETEDLVVTVAALQCTSAGALLTTPLALEAGDRVVYGGKQLPVLRPNAVEPTGTPIIYDRLVAGIRQAS